MENTRLNIILLVVNLLLVVFFIIIQSVNVNLNYTLQAKQEELNTFKEDNKILFLKIEGANDIKEIGRRAEEELEMIFPKKIEYIYE